MLPRRLQLATPRLRNGVAFYSNGGDNNKKDKDPPPKTDATGGGYGKPEDAHENEYFRRLQNEMLKKFKEVKGKIDQAKEDAKKNDKK